MDAPFRIAFFSDPHLGPLPPTPWRALIGKRATGFLNWRLNRRGRYDMAALDLLIADLMAAKLDHILCGGDLANLGLPAELDAAERLLRRMGSPSRVSLTPGNHCLYGADSEAAMFARLAPWMTGDGEERPAFPYLRRRGPLALIGLNSAAPTRPFDASGRLGATQIDAAFLLLTAIKAQGLCRILLIHHPPHVGGAPRARALRDAAAFEAMLAEAGAELVLHGHNHVTSLAFLPAAGGRRTPVVGVGSASERNAARQRRPCWLSIEISRAGESGFRLAAVERAVDANGAIVARALPLE